MEMSKKTDIYPNYQKQTLFSPMNTLPNDINSSDLNDYLEKYKVVEPDSYTWCNDLSLVVLYVNIELMKQTEMKDYVTMSNKVLTKDELIVILSIPYQEPYTNEQIDEMNTDETVMVYSC